jgi:hypothetical protein
MILFDAREQQTKGVWLLQPMADAQTGRDLFNLTTETAASRLRAKPAVTAALARRQMEEKSGSVGGGLFGSRPSPPTIPRHSRWFAYSSDRARYFETNFRVVMERRVTAVNLAAQLFRADHGHWPRGSEDLVPAYLPAIPGDLYHDDGRTIGFVVLRGGLPDGGDRPMLYFDPSDTNDVIVPTAPSYGWLMDPRPGKRRDVRQYRDLSRFVPPPSTQAVEDDPEESGAPGK